jgi:hypothetical protein
MNERQKIQQEAEAKLAEGRAALDKLKAELKEKGREASTEISQGITEAERVLDKGKARLSELAATTDEEFDKAWKDTKEAWHGVSRDIEHHWRSLSDRVKSHLA